MIRRFTAALCCLLGLLLLVGGLARAQLTSTGAGKKVTAAGGGQSFNFKAEGTVTASLSFNFAKGGGDTINSGDFILLVASMQGAAGADPGTMLPTGFTTIGSIDEYDGTHTANRFLIAYKIAGGAESGSYGSGTLAALVTGGWAMYVCKKGGTEALDASASSNLTGASTNIIAPSVSPAGSADMLIAVYVYGGDQGPYTTFSGMTNRVNTQVSKSSIIISDQVLSASGATGTRTATSTGNEFFITANVAVQ